MKEYLISLFKESAEKLSYLKDISIGFEIPKVESHGDLSCNAAMLLTKQLKKNPRDIAKEIIDHIDAPQLKIFQIYVKKKLKWILMRSEPSSDDMIYLFFEEHFLL